MNITIKNIIPNLVSLSTNLNKIYGLYFCDNFNFYKNLEEENPFHYRALIDNNIVIPPKYDFKSGYFIKFENN